MAKYTIVYHNQLPQRIEAESVTYDRDDEMFVFKDASKKPIAWAPKDDMMVVATAPAIDTP